MFEPQFPNHVFKSDVLNQTIGTFSRVNDTFASPRSISRKRKSIFDGCEESFSKRTRPNEEKFITLDIQAAAQPQPQSPTKTTSFIFNFKCNSCPKKFTKFGQYKSHITNDHDVSVHGDRSQEIKKSIKLLKDVENIEVFGGKFGDHC